MITNDEAQQTPYLHPEHTFLTTKQVFARYGWGRTRGYQMLATPGFPVRIGGSFRLDTLMAWEAHELKRQADAAADSPAEHEAEIAAEACSAESDREDGPAPSDTSPVQAGTPADLDAAQPVLTIPGKSRPRTKAVA